MTTLADTFAQSFEDVAGHVHRAKGVEDTVRYIIEIAKSIDATRLALALLPQEYSDAIATACAEAQIECVGPEYPADSVLDTIDGSQIGITGAQFAIAQSGTLVEVATDDAHRLVSALPRTHIGIVFESTMEPTLTGAAARLRRTFEEAGGHSAVSFISGPSRTGDIEMILTLGVHGPEHAHAVIIEGGDHA